MVARLGNVKVHDASSISRSITSLGIRNIYGRLGYLILLLVLLSVVWTIFLVMLQLFPNEMANLLMGTGELDEGRFWQLPEAEPIVSILGVLGLIGILLYYTYLVLWMARSGHRQKQTTTTPPVETAAPDTKEKRRKTIDKVAERVPIAVKRRWTMATILFGDVVQPVGRYRKLWNVVLEIPEVTLQTLTLLQYMEDGVNDSIIYAYTAFMMMNSLICFYFIQIAWRRPAFEEIVTDALLDVFFATLFPAGVLLYSIGAFDGDLESLRIAQRFFPPERLASVC